MVSIFDMLTRQQPQFQTRQALLVLGLQNDFVSSDGVLPVTNGHRFLKRIKNLVPAFRANGDVYWVRTENRSQSKSRARQDHGVVVVTSETATTRPADDLSDRVDSTLGNDESTTKEIKSSIFGQDADESSTLVSRPKHQADPELYLSATSDGARCCDPSGPGSLYTNDVHDLQSPKDTHLVKSQYSAFNGTSLLLTLRARLVTEIYLVGCMTNLCVYATALDAARHGLQINIVEDCLGYRTPHRHAEAINRMIDDMGAYMTTSKTVMSRFEDGDEPDRQESRGASPELEEGRHNVDLQDIAPFSYPSSIRHPNSSTMATRPTSAESQLPSLDPPQNGRIIPEYVASSCALGDVPRHLDTDEGIALEVDDDAKADFPLYQNMEAIRSIERIDTQARTEEWRNSCSPVDDPVDIREAQDAEISAALAGPSSPLSVSPPAMVESAEGRTSKKRRSADLDDLDLDLDSSPRQETSAAPVPTTESDQQPAQKKNKCIPSLANFPTKLPGDTIGKGDTTVSYNLLSSSDADKAFNILVSEVPWQRMTHVTGDVPRLVCCQGTFLSDGSTPVYRHPSDSTLPLFRWSPTVDRIRRLAEAHVGHRLNHALIQLYRSGQDHITEHSDKTLDIVAGSQIVNVSFGAQRTMRLRSKRMKYPPTYSSMSPEPEAQASLSSPPSIQPLAPISSTQPGSSVGSKETDIDRRRERSMPPSLRTIFDHPPNANGSFPARTTERIPLGHGSILSFGLDTNAHYLHGIQPDRRLPHDLSTAEQAYGAMRISLTFRNIGTFISPSEDCIWGIGARAKTRTGAGLVFNGDTAEGEAAAGDLLRAFGRENQGAGTPKEEVYGQGSDVLHLKTVPAKETLVFLSGHAGRDAAILAAVKHLGLSAQVTPATDLGLDQLLDDKTHDGKASDSKAKSKDQKRYHDAEGNTIPLPRTDRDVLLRDTDEQHSEIRGWIAVLSYLARYHEGEKSRHVVAREQELFALLPLFELFVTEDREGVVDFIQRLEGQLQMQSEESKGLAGRVIGVVDVGFHHLIKTALEGREGFDRLHQWAEDVEQVLVRGGKEEVEQ
ncbi:Hypothetical protein D9617_17g046950 [Elsinoe fawcettii]|nr:Hypothetical protein D9617_17g046950 [Elsinoe fawcettii]